MYSIIDNRWDTARAGAVFVCRAGEASEFQRPSLENQALSHALLIGVLLNGSLKRAEAAVVNAIAAWNMHDPLERALIRGVIDGILIGSAGGFMPENADDQRSTRSVVPEALCKVLALPAELRRCFVLRALLMLPRLECSQLLRITGREVDRYLRDAVIELAGKPDLEFAKRREKSL